MDRSKRLVDIQISRTSFAWIALALVTAFVFVPMVRAHAIDCGAVAHTPEGDATPETIGGDVSGDGQAACNGTVSLVAVKTTLQTHGFLAVWHEEAVLPNSCKDCNGVTATAFGLECMKNGDEIWRSIADVVTPGSDSDVSSHFTVTCPYVDPDDVLHQ